jgi:tetratricopeptide (TPR) repeat protein
LNILSSALTIAREVKDRVGEAYALNHVGFAYNNLGRSEKALEYYEQALAIAREMKDRAVEGDAPRQLGSAYLTLDSRSEKAIENLEEALGSIAR